MAAAATITLDAPWLIRPYDASVCDEEGALMYVLGVGYTRSRSGVRAEANRAGGSTSEKERAGAPRDPQRNDKQRAFLSAHRFVWEWLLKNADVSIAVDPSNPGSVDTPASIWAWLVTTGDVIHAVGCKRSLIAEKLSVDIVRDMLGARLSKHQVCSLELPQMRTRGSEGIGIDRPSSWSMDPTWLLTRIPR